MTPPDPLTRLRAADPVTWLREQTGADAPSPAAVLARIVATPPREPRRPRPPRRRIALAALVVATAVVALVVALAPDTRVDLAARAYAATAPDASSVFYTETVSETTSTREDIPGQVTETRMWQHGDRMHDVMSVRNDEGKRWRYEHEQNGDRFRTLNPDGTVDSMRIGDPGWNREETEQVFELGRQTIIERFRARYAGSQLRDVSETTFAGRRARAYEVTARPNTPAQRETFYLDAETGLPLGSVHVIPLHDVEIDPSTRRPRPPSPDEKPSGEMRHTEIVKRFERLEPTPESLALLDAPAIDAGKPNKP